MISDDDYDVQLPKQLSEQSVLEGDVGSVDQALLFPSLVHVARSMGQLHKTLLRCPVIGRTTLETYERNFTACLDALPVKYNPKAEGYLEPYCLPAIVCLQNARFTLHRHNISPVCPLEVRQSALNYCLSIALDTSRLITRCLQNPPGLDRSLMMNSNLTPRASACTMVCTHICRCVLVLLFRREYDAALECVRISAMIGDSPSANVASGRYIAFFLSCMLDRLKQNNMENMEWDEEMIAYMSGDMQGTAESSWVWQDEASSSSSSAADFEDNNTGGLSPGADELWSAREGEGEGEEDELWEGWQYLEETIEFLRSEKQQQQQQHFNGEEEITQQQLRLHSASLNPLLLNNKPPEASTSSAQSRMTIANII